PGAESCDMAPARHNGTDVGLGHIHCHSYVLLTGACVLPGQPEEHSSILFVQSIDDVGPCPERGGQRRAREAVHAYTACVYRPGIPMTEATDVTSAHRTRQDTSEESESASALFYPQQHESNIYPSRIFQTNKHTNHTRQVATTSSLFCT